jgi:hypothetical protein
LKKDFLSLNTLLDNTSIFLGLNMMAHGKAVAQHNTALRSIGLMYGLHTWIQVLREV